MKKHTGEEKTSNLNFENAFTFAERAKCDNSKNEDKKLRTAIVVTPRLKLKEDEVKEQETDKPEVKDNDNGLDGDPCSFVETIYGNPMVVDKFQQCYYKHKAQQSTIIWKCRFVNKTKCKARVHTNVDATRIIKYWESHTHDSK